MFCYFSSTEMPQEATVQGNTKRFYIHWKNGAVPIDKILPCFSPHFTTACWSTRQGLLHWSTIKFKHVRYLIFSHIQTLLCNSLHAICYCLLWQIYIWICHFHKTNSNEREGDSEREAAYCIFISQTSASFPLFHSGVCVCEREGVSQKGCRADTLTPGGGAINTSVCHICSCSGRRGWKVFGHQTSQRKSWGPWTCPKDYRVSLQHEPEGQAYSSPDLWLLWLQVLVQTLVMTLCCWPSPVLCTWALLRSRDRRLWLPRRTRPSGWTRPSHSAEPSPSLMNTSGKRSIH